MVQTMARVANLSGDRGGIAPHMRKVGRAHKAYDLAARDFDNFKCTFLDLIGVSSDVGGSHGGIAPPCSGLA